MHLNTNAPMGWGRVMILFYSSDSHLLVNLALNGRATGLGESTMDHNVVFHLSILDFNFVS